MWFKLAGATFTNNLGTMDSISKSYMMDYSGLTGLQASPGSVSYATDSTPDATITFTVKSGYVFKSGSTVTASGGASKTYTASADIAAGSSFTMALTGISNKVTFVGAAELVSSGGNTGGGGGGSEGNEPETPVNPPAGDTSNLLTLGTLHENTVTASTTSAELKTDAAYFTYEKIPVSPNTNYISVGGRRMFQLDSSGAVLGASVNINNNSPQGSFTTSSNCAYVTISYKYDDLQPSEATLTVA